MAKTKIGSAILYRGPSMLDGSRIIMIATGIKTSSKNAKTGNMIQTWILREDIAPHIAIKSGDDASICGNCRHRGRHDGKRWTSTRTCYVQVHNAPTSIWRAYHRGSYGSRVSTPMQTIAIGTGRKVRIGSYGDPAAVPARVWDMLTTHASGWTGYTHQWAHMSAKRAARMQRYCMASCDTLAERAEAQARGWRTFTVTPDRASVPALDVLCPASAEAGRKSTCAKCGLCKGTASTARKSVSIPAHGSGARAFARALAAQT